MPRKNADFYGQLWPIARTMIDRRFDRSVTGVENIPEGPVIVAANHIRMVDSPIVAVSYTEATGNPLRFAAKREFFDGEGVDGKGKWGRVAKWVLEHTDMIPVDRESRSRSDLVRFQQEVARRLHDGDGVGIHPEGTRSDDGKLHKFKSGAAGIAIARTVPIVPVGLTYERYSNGRKTHVDVMFGEALTSDDYQTLPYSMLPGRQKAEYFTSVVEQRVADLTGMERSGMFAQLHKLRRGAAAEEPEQA